MGCFSVKFSVLNVNIIKTWEDFLDVFSKFTCAVFL